MGVQRDFRQFLEILEAIGQVVSMAELLSGPGQRSGPAVWSSLSFGNPEAHDHRPELHRLLLTR